MDKIRNQAIDNLMSVFAGLTSADDCYAFFTDLCTIKEIQDMAQRFEAAIMLNDGAKYQDIATSVKTSAATISRVSRCLKYGSGGYEKAIAIFKGENHAD
jgi:TrpR-related protein YerC/YecD